MNRSLHSSLRGHLFILLITTGLIAIATTVSAQPVNPSPTQTPAIASEQQQIIAERFLDLIVDGKYEEARQYLHPTLADEWTPEVLKERWETFQNRTGGFVRRLNSRTLGQLVLITIEFTEVTDDAIFIFDDNQQITGIDFPLQPAQIINE